MKPNIGNTDRLIRLIFAIILLILSYTKMSLVLLLIGLFVLFEAAYGWCIVYQILGKSSCEKK